MKHALGLTTLRSRKKASRRSVSIIVREIRDRYVNTAAPPASTMLEIQKLAREGALIEIEAIAVLPAK
jgi:enamine deaminase RidA (YjgF/YER057c/UK114 family)